MRLTFSLTMQEMYDAFSETKDGLEQTCQINFLTHIYLTASLLKYLVKGGRVINLSSTAHKIPKAIDTNLIEDINYSRQNYGLWKLYGLSKLANVYFSACLAKYFESNKLEIKSMSLHPGAVYSDLASHATNRLLKILVKLLTPLFLIFFKDEFMGAQTTLNLVYLDFNSLVNGGYYEDCKVKKVSALARDDSSRTKVMQSCLKIIQQKVDDYPKELDVILSS